MMMKDVKALAGVGAGIVGAMVYRQCRGGEFTVEDAIFGAVGGLVGMLAPEVLALGPAYHAGVALLPALNPLGRIAERTQRPDWFALLTTITTRAITAGSPWLR
jgi:hypothetical protein